MIKIQMEFEKEFIDWWVNRWPEYIRENQTIMIIAGAAWDEAERLKGIFLAKSEKGE